MIVEHKKNHKFRQWNCGSCGKLLGFIYKNGTVTMKYKEFFVWVTGGEIKTICRYCSTENNYSPSTNIEVLLDNTEQLPEK